MNRIVVNFIVTSFASDGSGNRQELAALLSSSVEHPNVEQAAGQASGSAHVLLRYVLLRTDRTRLRLQPHACLVTGKRNAVANGIRPVPGANAAA